MRNRKVVGNLKTQGKATLKYFTYYLIFPDDTYWVDQIPIAHSLEYELLRTTFGRIPKLREQMIKNKECSWKDHNGVWHKVVLERQRRLKIWGKGNGFTIHT